MAHINELHLPHIDTLLADAGDVNIGYLHPVGQVAVASDLHNPLAMLRRSVDESLADALLRLDAAVATAMEHGTFTDEING